MPPTFDMVYSIYSNDEDIKKNDSLAAAMDKLYQFQVFEGDPSKTESLFKALDGVVVIVNHKNAMDTMSKAQVKSIFTGETTDWSQLSQKAKQPRLQVVTTHFAIKTEKYP